MPDVASDETGSTAESGVTSTSNLSVGVSIIHATTEPQTLADVPSLSCLVHLMLPVSTNAIRRRARLTVARPRPLVCTAPLTALCQKSADLQVVPTMYS
jgi:hypothetical protein